MLPPQVAGTMALQNLQKLAQNPEAMAALQKVFASAGPQAGARSPVDATGGSTGLEALYNTVARQSQRTMAELDQARAEIEKLKVDAEAWRKHEEAKRFEQTSNHMAKLKIQAALVKIVDLAVDKGGNELLSEAMIELAQGAGVPLTPDQIDTLSGVVSKTDTDDDATNQ